MQIPKQMSLTETKTFIQSMIKESGLIESLISLDEMMKYSDQSDMIELGLRCVCIDRDIERLKEMQHCATEELTYNINNILCALETEDEIRLFWSALHPNDIIVLAYFNQNYIES